MLQAKKQFAMDLDKSRRDGAALQAEVKKIQEAAKKDNDKAQVDISKRLTLCNMLHHVANNFNILQYTATHFQNDADQAQVDVFKGWTHCTTPQHTYAATPCSTLQNGCRKGEC